jgi:hypothetical protein
MSSELKKRPKPGNNKADRLPLSRLLGSRSYGTGRHPTRRDNLWSHHASRPLLLQRDRPRYRLGGDQVRLAPPTELYPSYPGEHREPVAPLAEQYDAYAGRGFGCFFLWDYLELVVRADQGTGSFGV